MALSRRGFMKGLSAVAAALMPIGTVDVQSKEFENTEPFGPPEESFWDTPTKDLVWDEQWECWRHPDDIAYQNAFPPKSGECLKVDWLDGVPEHTYIHNCSGVIPTYKPKKKHSTPCVSG